MIRALLGGTFDPPHLAHLALAEAAYRQLGVSAVEFIPTGVPWWKPSPPPTAAHHRLEMVKRATEGVSYFTVNDCETRRDGPSYMADTLETFPSRDEIYLVLGSDAAQGLRSWMRWEEVARRVRLAVALRPGTDASTVEEAVGESPVWLDCPPMAISSRQVRLRIRAGESIRRLVPGGVWEYIAENRLYASPEGL
ncbi:MAG: nicotinate-nucleotide adenylyltransferase [bacterium]|nr:nicotinate-nucleotide adenylyltransferase [bacterium]MDE0674697.1 nicotinate-nucleotide adenylyltransferase [bacterium]